VAAGGKVFLLSQSGVVTVLRAGGGQEVIAVKHAPLDCLG
jgi:hypothetical protein